MLKTIDFIEVTLNKRGIKEKGLFLHYDEETRMIRLVTDNNNTTGSFSLTFAPITGILMQDAESAVSTVYNRADGSQKLAIELLLEASHQLKKDNRLNVAGFVNISSYKNIPDKYKKLSVHLPATVNNSTNIIGAPPINQTTVYTPKVSFLGSKPAYHANYAPSKKIAIIFRKSELPTAKMLKAMNKRVTAAGLNIYKLKAKPLSEEDVEVEKSPEAQDYLNGYNDYDEFPYNGLHGRIM